MGLSERQKNCRLSCFEKDHATVELPAPSEPTLGVIDLTMLLRMVCTNTAKGTIFGELLDQLLGTVLGLERWYITVVGDNYTNEESIKSLSQHQAWFLVTTVKYWNFGQIMKKLILRCSFTLHTGDTNWESIRYFFGVWIQMLQPCVKVYGCIHALVC